MSEEVNTNQPAAGGTDGKTMGIISYLTWIGTLIAFIMNNDKKDDLAAFHIRQNIGFILLAIVGGIAVYILIFIMAAIKLGLIGTILLPIFYIGLFILWIIGFLGAVKGEKKLMPVVGEMFQKWFKGIQAS